MTRNFINNIHIFWAIIKPRRMRWAGHATHIGEKRNILMGKPEGKRPL
jgi:hypothetical protein